MALVHRFRPVVTSGNKTFDILYDIQSDEVKSVNDSIAEIFRNTFIKTANEKGIRNFEKIYNLGYNPELSLEERRSIVYNWMIYKPPFTKQRFNLLLKNILEIDNFMFVIDSENFFVIVSIPMLDRNSYDSYVNKIREIIPANMELIPSTPYTYLYLSTLTYGSEAVYTDVGAGNGDYDLTAKGYVYVETGNGRYTLEAESDFTDPNKLCYYTYRELSKYSVFDVTNDIRLAVNADGTSRNTGEIVDLAGAGIAYVSEV